MREDPTADDRIDMRMERLFSNGCCILRPIGAADARRPEQADTATAFAAATKASG